MKVPEEKLGPIKETIFSGQKIAAIKLYREATGAGLTDAKNEVEKIETELRAASPEKFKAAPAGKGCLGVIVMICAAVVLVGALTGCRGTLRTTSKHELPKFDGGSQPVYVTNPGLRREYEVLKASGIYPLSSSPDSPLRLTLHPIWQYGRCGNPLMLTGLTFGIIPGVVSATHAFEYDLESDGKVQKLSHRLALYERVSLWEHFVRHNDNATLAEALAWSSLVNQSDFTESEPR